MTNYLELPKVELHVHLDGSVRPKTMQELLGISYDEIMRKAIIQDDCTSLETYLEAFTFPIEAMQTKENIRRISKELAEDLKAENVIYAEVRFAPIFHTKKGLDVSSVIKAVLDGFRDVSDMKLNLILCLMRGVSLEENKKTIEAGKEWFGKGVVAFDLAGDEAHYSVMEYRDLLDEVIKLGYPLTLHAGEADGAQSVLNSLSFQPTRIGHGVRVLEDASVVEQCMKEGVTLEVCPISNVHTGIFATLKEHNIKELDKKGLRITINTDNRTVSNISLTKTYELLASTFGFDESDFRRFNKYAIQSAFLSKDEKEALLQKL